MLQWMPGAAGIVSFSGVRSQIPGNSITAIHAASVQSIRFTEGGSMDGNAEIFFLLRMGRLGVLKRSSMPTFQVKNECELYSVI
jgi:hypothetical protein